MIHILTNGMRLAFKRSSSPVSYCAIHVRTGTRYEEKGFEGLAHFTEHLIFKGTCKKSSSVINSRIERLGGELNAYTTKEETVIHATLLKEDISVGISLLVELAFTSLFPAKELEKERAVVMEEIQSYKDSPAEQIYDDFEELLFAGTPLSTPVLGSCSSLKKIKREKVLEYYRRMFIPENMFFTVVADMEERKVLSLLEKALSRYAPLSLSGGSTGMQEALIREEIVPEYHFEKSVQRKSHQAHSIIGCNAYSLYDPRRIPLILLVNIIGGPAANSKLNLLLRERYGLVYSIDSGYTQYTDAGVVTIYFGCDKSNVDRCSSLVLKTLAEYREHLISERALKEAKKQLLGQLAISSDNGEAQVLSMGKSLMVFGRVVEQQESRAMIESVTAEDIKRVSCEIFAPEKLSKLTYL